MSEENQKFEISPEEEMSAFVISRELDLHTFRPREYPALLDDYLEEALNLGYRTVRIIHGRGIGFQRKRVQELLKNHPLVQSFSDDYDSRLGATFVQLVLKAAEET